MTDRAFKVAGHLRPTLKQLPLSFLAHTFAVSNEIRSQNLHLRKPFRLVSSHRRIKLYAVIHLISSQSLNLGGRRGTTGDIATIPFHSSLSSAALRESPNPIPVHSLMLSSHLFFYLHLLLAPFTIPCRIVFAMPEDLEMWPYHLSFRFFTMVRRLSCTSVAFWILLRTSSSVTWSL